MTVSAERELLSIGMLASHVRHPVRAIEQAATKLHIEPAMKINGVVYFDASQCEQLTDAINAKGSK